MNANVATMTATPAAARTYRLIPRLAGLASLASGAASSVSGVASPLGTLASGFASLASTACSVRFPVLRGAAA